MELGVRRLETLHLLALLDARPVIDEVLDRDALGQLLQAADVVDVVMRQDQVIDVRDASLGQHRQDAIRVARVRVARVDSTDSPDGETKSVAFPPSVSTGRCRTSLPASSAPGRGHEQRQDGKRSERRAHRSPHPFRPQRVNGNRIPRTTAPRPPFPEESGISVRFRREDLGRDVERSVGRRNPGVHRHL